MDFVELNEKSQLKKKESNKDQFFPDQRLQDLLITGKNNTDAIDSKEDNFNPYMIDGREVPDSMKPYINKKGTFDYDKWQQDLHERQLADAKKHGVPSDNMAEESEKSQTDRTTINEGRKTADERYREMIEKHKNVDHQIQKNVESEKAGVNYEIIDRGEMKADAAGSDDTQNRELKDAFPDKTIDKSVVENGDKLGRFPKIEGFDKSDGSQNSNDEIKEKLMNRIPPSHLQDIPSITFDKTRVQSNHSMGETNLPSNEITIFNHPSHQEGVPQESVNPESYRKHEEMDTLYHEIGHPVFNSLTDDQKQEWETLCNKSPANGGDGPATSFTSKDYIPLDAEEDFCEMYARFAAYPKSSDLAYPEKTAFMKKIWK